MLYYRVCRGFPLKTLVLLTAPWCLLHGAYLMSWLRPLLIGSVSFVCVCFVKYFCCGGVCSLSVCIF